MKKIKLFFLAMAMLVSAVAYAQNMTVTGVVKDSSTGEGVPFASLQLKGTMTGTSTDGDGFYTITVPADGVLVFSSVGYLTLEVPVAGKAQHNVLLDPDSEALEETIVVAFADYRNDLFARGNYSLQNGKSRLMSAMRCANCISRHSTPPPSEERWRSIALP